jgi:oxaloacetate decarboxylase alpha subunit
LDKEVVKKVLGGAQPLDPAVKPSSLVTTTFDEVAAEAGDLARSEEDVLMWALFPNEARTYLSKHRTTGNIPFLMEEEAAGTKEEQTVDMNQIRELIRTVQESGVGEVTVEEAGSKITVRAAGQHVETFDNPIAKVEPQAAPAETPTPTQPGTQGNRPAEWVEVKAPMVGTFYAAPAPDKPPYVQVGDEVTAGQALCIVEAMKLMNEIKSEQMGVVREVCVENAQPVEYGTVLFYLEPIADNPPTIAVQ